MKVRSPMSNLAHLSESYLPRVVDEQVERYLSLFGAVEISGTKWCGKTWTALMHGKSASFVDDDYSVALADPGLMTLGEQPHVIDEWQLVPRIWDVVRRKIDAQRSLHGGWILTGSSTPPSLKDGEGPRHSGAGRIGRIRMHPLSLAESGDSVGTVSLKGLFEGVFAPGMMAPDSKDALPLVDVVCKGGWPEAIDMDVASAQTVAREYLRLLYTESIPRHRKSPDTASRLVTSVARTLGQATTHKTLIADMFGGEEPFGGASLSREALASYLALLKSLYLLVEIPGWVPESRSPKRLSTKPKRYLADPSLAAAQLGMGPKALVHDWQAFGTMFENLCIRDLLVYAQALPDIGFEPIRYYRDDSGLEADAIIELADGRWAAFEVKVSEEGVPAAASNLKRLREKLCGNPKARVREPEFMAVITGLSHYAREVDEGIYSIPLRALAP